MASLLESGLVSEYGISTADAVPALISFFDADHVCRFANDHHINWYGRSPTDLVGLHMREFLGEESYLTRLPHLARVAAGESVSIEADVPHLEGGWREAAIRYVPRMGPGGFEGFHTLVFDLSREQNRFHSVFDGTAVGFIEINLTKVHAMVVAMTDEGDDVAARVAADLSFVRRALEIAPVIGLNEKACSMMLADPSQAIGGPLGRWCPDESLPAWNRVFLGYITGAVSYEEESVIARTDGSTLDVILTAAFPKRPEDQVRVVVGFVDVSERVAKERALARAQLELAHAMRVATLGELMASIAHEVNQPLGAVVANGNAAYRWLNRPVPDIEEAKAAIQRMISEGGRASEIIARTRRMALKGAADRSDFELMEMITEAVDITRRQVASLGAVLTLDSDGGAPVLCGDRIQLQQVIINLVVNAAQAMAEQPQGSRRIDVRVVNEPGQARIEVSDTGPGLGDTEPARLFDAFFTTKADGMGMGLSVSKSIVEAHSGSIDVVARPTGGTLFQVKLPLD